MQVEEYLMGLHFSKIKGFKKAGNKKTKYPQIPGTSTIVEEDNPQRFLAKIPPIKNMESSRQSSSSDCSSITSIETTTNIPSHIERTAGSSSCSRHRHHSHHRHHHRHSKKKESSEEDEQNEGIPALCSMLGDSDKSQHCCRRKKSSAYPSRRCCKCAHRSSRNSVNLNTSASSSSTCSSAISSPIATVVQARPESGEIILPISGGRQLVVIPYPGVNEGNIDPLVPELASALIISNERQRRLGRAQLTTVHSNHLIVHSQVNYYHCLVPDLEKITSSCYYWGKMDRYEAERLLEGKPEGTFLLRDSAQDEYLFSVTFRKYGRSLHARIEQSEHQFRWVFLTSLFINFCFYIEYGVKLVTFSFSNFHCLHKLLIVNHSITYLPYEASNCVINVGN